MARLPGFHDVGPPQGPTNLCGPASVVCGGTYLRHAASLAVTTLAELQLAVQRSGANFSQGGGAPRVVDFAAHMGIPASARCAHLGTSTRR
jgi:hypothetical protein